jgi:hypothetical protein
VSVAVQAVQGHIVHVRPIVKSRHAPETQTSVTVHALPQLPQLDTSSAKVVQASPHRVRGPHAI